MNERDPRPEEILDNINAHVTANAKRWEAKISELQVFSEEDARRLSHSPIEEAMPWFTYGRDAVLGSRSISRHETFGHPVGVLLAVSSLSPDPLNAFASLYAATQAQSCDVFSNRPYVDPNVLRYYVLIHDCAQGGDMEESKTVLESVKRIYGLNCCILPLNSASQQEPQSASPPQSDDLKGSHASQTNSENVSHSPPYDEELWSEDDARRLSGLIREMVAQSLVPWMERCVTQWNDSIAASRKGLSGRLFGAGKRFFGSNAIARAGSTQERPSWDAQSGFYPHAAIEAQTRRLADFAFMIRDYKLAAAMYDFGRKDYANDKAHQYSAGATEMFGLSHLMMMLSSNSPPIDVDSYLASACALYRLPAPRTTSGVLLRPLRATLLYYEVYRAINFYRSAPSALIRVAQDPGADLEVMGAMLIEQAAMADLRIFDRPALRKWALHLVMAGHRYRQCGAKLLSLRCFSAAQVIYCQKRIQVKSFLEDEISTSESLDVEEEVLEGWTMIQAHVEHELGQQALNDGQTEQAVDHFLRTIRPTRTESSEGANSFEIRKSLHETYLKDLETALSLTYSSGHGETEIESPFGFFDPQKSRFKLQEEDPCPSDAAVWGELEACLDGGSANTTSIDVNGDGRPLHSSSQSRSFTIGVPFQLLLRVVNPLSAPLTVSDVTIEFTQDPVLSSSAAGAGLEIDQLENIQLEPQEERDVPVNVVASSLGRYRASRITFRLNGMPNFSQELHKHGRRMNATREQRMSRKAIYAPDETLAVTIREPAPVFEAEMVDWPTKVGVGEEVDVVIRLKNRGMVAAKNGIRMLADKPEMIAAASVENRVETQMVVANALSSSEPITILAVEEDLAAGESVDKTLRLRGAMPGGNVQLRLLFFTGSGPKERIKFRLSQTVEVHPVVDLSVEVSPAPTGFAYDLAISAVNVHPDGQPVRITNMTFISPRWVTPQGNVISNVDFGAPQVFSSLLPLHQVTTHTTIVERPRAEDESDPMALLDYTSHHLAALLRGRDIDRTAIADPCSLCISSTETNSCSYKTSPLLAVTRTAWRRKTIEQHFPTVVKADRDRVFTLYSPDDLDILIDWETQDKQHAGQIFILGLALGPSRDLISQLVSSLAAGAAGRSLYEETAREKAALLANLTRSYLGTEEDPLFVNIQTGEANVIALETFPVVFVVRNMSTSRSARCTINLSSPVDSSGGRRHQDQRQEDEEYVGRDFSLPLPPRTSLWIGRLTLRSQTIPPRGVVELMAHARRPKMGEECELADWSVKSEVLAGEREGEEEVIKHFYSGRLKSRKAV